MHHDRNPVKPQTRLSTNDYACRSICGQHADKAINRTPDPPPSDDVLMTTPADRYGSDVLATGPSQHRREAVPEVDGEPGLVIECADSGWCGAIVGWEKTIEGWAVRLEDRHDKTRLFPARPSAFLLDGQHVTVVRPTFDKTTSQTAQRTASGSISVPNVKARVARASRIWVEGKHDAELVEKVWGDDLRIEGVVVELLDGIDHLADLTKQFRPGPNRRIGVLVDHLITNSKETRIAAEVMARYPDDVLVVGHPFVDIWQAITPHCAGIERWPTIPRGQDWKTGICSELGWDANTGIAWKNLLGRVSRWTDLDPKLIGPVEQLIDFVTEIDSE